MDTESQVIQEQMRQTRASLAEKIERLEDRVLGAVDETPDHRRRELRAADGPVVGESADVDRLQLGDRSVDASA